MVSFGRKQLNIIFTLTVLVILFCFISSEADAKAATDIRVGLKSSYFDKKIITVYNTVLKM